VAEAGDVFGIQRPSGSVPFVITHCCIAADGWEVEGKVLCGSSPMPPSK
jgi:hypothetical protein